MAMVAISVGISVVVAIGILIGIQVYQEVQPQSQMQNPSCYGTAGCYTGKVTKIVDGDTIHVDHQSIRFALVDTSEIGQVGYNEAKNFVANTCPVGSDAVVDVDDEQPRDIYDRIVATIYCKGVNLNQAIIEQGLGYFTGDYCDGSEFSNSWALQACRSMMQPITVTETTTQTTQSNCDPAYPDVCIPSPPPDLDCKDVPYSKFTVLPPDPHRFDSDDDGIGCELKKQTTTESQPSSEQVDCDPAYPDVCIAPYPPDLDCGEIPYTDFVVLQPDSHGFDGDYDGIGCESYQPPSQSSAQITPEPTPDCDPSYPDFCIPPPPPDLDCGDIDQKRFTVLQPDPHRFDVDKDGIGCES